MVRDVSCHFSYYFYSGVISLRKCGTGHIGLMRSRVDATPIQYEFDRILVSDNIKLFAAKFLYFS